MLVIFIRLNIVSNNDDNNMINYGFKFYINKGEVIILLCKRLYSKNIYRNNSNTFMRVIYIIAQMCTDVYGYLNLKHNK